MRRPWKAAKKRKGELNVDELRKNLKDADEALAETLRKMGRGELNLLDLAWESDLDPDGRDRPGS